MAVLLAVASAASGTQWLPMAGLLVVVAALCALITSGMFIASAKLDQLSVGARYVTILAELVLFGPGVVLAAFGSYGRAHAGSPANPGTDGPFADGGQGLIALTGMTYAAGAVVVIGLLLLAPTVRRSSRK